MMDQRRHQALMKLLQGKKAHSSRNSDTSPLGKNETDQLNSLNREEDQFNSTQEERKMTSNEKYATVDMVNYLDKKIDEVKKETKLNFERVNRRIDRLEDQTELSFQGVNKRLDNLEQQTKLYHEQTKLYHEQTELHLEQTNSKIDDFKKEILCILRQSEAERKQEMEDIKNLVSASKCSNPQHQPSGV